MALDNRGTLRELSPEEDWRQLGGKRLLVRPSRSLVSPGRQCLQAEGIWSIESINASASTNLTTLDLNVAAGQTHFVRLEKGSGLLFPGMTCGQ